MKRILLAAVLLLSACEVGGERITPDAGPVKRVQFHGSCTLSDGNKFFLAVCAEVGDAVTALEELETNCVRIQRDACKRCTVEEVDAPCCWEE
jgi:hypothetical protein